MISREQLLDDISMRLQLLQAIYDVTEECERLPTALLHEVAWNAFRTMRDETDADFYSRMVGNLVNLRLGYHAAVTKQ